MKVAVFCKTEYWMELHVDSTTNSIQYPILHSILNVSMRMMKILLMMMKAIMLMMRMLLANKEDDGRKGSL